MKQLDLGGAREAEQLIIAAKPYAIKDRYIIQGNAQVQKKAERLKASTTNNELSIERFNRILSAVRMEAGHKRVATIRQGDSMYITLKEVAQLAYDFADEFDIKPRDEGYKIFCTLGVRFMANTRQYNIHKFKTYKEKIYTVYESHLFIADDQHKLQTEAIYKAWRERLRFYTGLDRRITAPEDYVCFVYMRMEIDKHQAYIQDWIDAQFEEMQGWKATPNLTQMFGEAAEKRYLEWLAKTRKAYKGNFVEISHETHRSEFEKRYFEALRKKRATE